MAMEEAGAGDEDGEDIGDDSGSDDEEGDGDGAMLNGELPAHGACALFMLTQTQSKAPHIPVGHIA